MPFMAPVLTALGMSSVPAAAGAAAAGTAVGSVAGATSLAGIAAASGGAIGGAASAALGAGTLFGGGTLAGIGTTTAAAGAGLTLGQGLMIGSSLISGISKYRQGQAEKLAYEANAEAIEQNMRSEERKSQIYYSDIKGKQRTLYGAAGVELTSGSPLLIMADTAWKEKEAQMDINQEGTMGANYQRLYGRKALKSGMYGGLSTFITGLGTATVLR